VQCFRIFKEDTLVSDLNGSRIVVVLRCSICGANALAVHRYHRATELRTLERCPRRQDGCDAKQNRDHDLDSIYASLPVFRVSMLNRVSHDQGPR
jgi:hypothetical protein